MGKTKNIKSELNAIKSILIFIALFNIISVAGLFLAGYGTASLPAPVANFLLSETFVYLLNGVLALGVVLCFVAITKVGNYMKKHPAKQETKENGKEKHSDSVTDEEDIPDEITADDILRVANAARTEDLTQKALAAKEAAQSTTEEVMEDAGSLNDILSGEDDPFVTDARKSNVADNSENIPVAPTADIAEAVPPEPESFEQDIQVESTPAQPDMPPQTQQNLPSLNNLEQMLKEALVTSQVPTALYGIEEDKEGAVCIACNPADGEWYVYEIHNGEMKNFSFYAKDNGHEAGKTFLERVKAKMNSVG